jgi:hypothetical protein
LIDPARAWACGQSIVSVSTASLNDKGTLLNKGVFTDNGGCGYVLKPSFMRNKGRKLFPKCYVLIHIISAQWLPHLESTSEVLHHHPHVLLSAFLLIVSPSKPPCAQELDSVSIEVELCGLPQDNQSYRTETWDGTGRNPVWDEVSGFDHNISLRTDSIVLRLLVLMLIAPI